MLKILALLLAITSPLAPLPAQAENLGPKVVRVSIIRTGTVQTLESFAYAEGSWFSRLTLNHSAILVDHPKGRFLFDTGLGEHINSQFSQDMPWWGHLFFSYRRQDSAARQLREAGERTPDKIILSHCHWDHASGLPDFKGIPVLMPKEEMSFLEQPHPGAVLKSQFDIEPGRTAPIALEDRPFRGYARSLDIYGDGSAVLVGMPGHTPGSIGLLVRTAGGKELFFVGDVVWTTGALAAESPKFWLAGRIVDHDDHGTLAAIRQLKAFMAAHPAVTIVPAHDAAVQDRLGYFPQWIR